ncbi:MAG: exonuclease SbcCD subunit D [Actinomycetia bacterium]|nr:exonuclease SbcCD subunit D [Actinomycetes bacterium]
MRLLHTSDWHLGRGLHGVDLHEAQQQVVRQVVEAVRADAVDAVLICGDIYDRAVPPVTSVRLWSDALGELSALAPVIVIPGNHDSATRLGAGSDLFRAGVHIVTDLNQVGTPIELHDDTGPVLVYPIPFLDPDVARHALSNDGEPLGRSHEAVMTAAMDRIRRDLSDRRRSQPAARAVVMAHAFVVSGGSTENERSESERDLRIGGVDSVRSTVFDDVDYVALGHLHGAQRVGEERVRYAGSPMRYSFSEVNQQKQLLRVDLGPSGLRGVESIPVKQPRSMAAISGTFDELLTSDTFDAHSEAWVQVTVTDDARPAQLVAQIRSRFPGALIIRHEPVSGPLVDRGAGSLRVPSQPTEVAGAFVRYVTGADISTGELAAFANAYEQALAEARSA